MTSPSTVAQQLRGPSAVPGGTWGGARGTAAGLALAVAVCFSLAMLAAQTFGLLHGILHSQAAAAVDGAPSLPSAATAVADDGVGPARTSSASFLTHLFPVHPVDSDCRAYDQLSHFDAAPSVAALVLPLVLTPVLLSTLTGLATARWHALFQARGPPPLR